MSTVHILHSRKQKWWHDLEHEKALAKTASYMVPRNCNPPSQTNQIGQYFQLCTEILSPQQNLKKPELTASSTRPNPLWTSRTRRLYAWLVPFQAFICHSIAQILCGESFHDLKNLKPYCTTILVRHAPTSLRRPIAGLVRQTSPSSL